MSEMLNGRATKFSHLLFLSTFLPSITHTPTVRPVSVFHVVGGLGGFFTPFVTAIGHFCVLLPCSYFFTQTEPEPVHS